MQSIAWRALVLGALTLPVFAGDPPAADDAATKATADGTEAAADATKPTADDAKAKTDAPLTLEERVAALEKRKKFFDPAARAADEFVDTADADSGVFQTAARRIRLKADVRIRGEFHDHIYKPTDPNGQNSVDFYHMRTRLRFDIDVTDKTFIVIELQDVRFAGEPQSTIGVIDRFDLKRGNIVFQDLFKETTDLQIGRYFMHYGDDRLIGHLEWFDQGRTYDGFRIHYQKDNQTKREGKWVDMFFALVRETLLEQEDQTLWGLYGGVGKLELYGLLFNENRATMGEVRTSGSTFTTFGARYKAKRGPWDYTAEASAQLGHVNGDDLEAWAGAITIGHVLEGVKRKPRLFITVAFATGDKDPNDGKQDAFQTLFPTNHIHYGYADLVGWSNILNLHIGVQHKISSQWGATLQYHHFRLDQESGAWVNAGGATVRRGTPGLSSHLGDEIDFTLKWQRNRMHTVSLGVAFFIPGDFIKETGESPDATFFYLQTRVHF